MKTVHSRLRGAGRRRTGRWSTLLLTLVAVAAAQAPPSRQLQQIEAWLRQHPQDAVAWERAAAVQLELKQPDAAATSLEHVLALRPADTRVRLTLLQLLTSNPRCVHPAESASGQQTAADVAPCGARIRRLWQGLPQAAQNDAAVEVLKVRVLLAEGEPSQAATFVSQLAAQHATDAKMQFTLGATLLQAGEAAAALPRLQAARRLLGPKHSDEALTFDLALAHFHLGDARAEPEFRQLHQRHPDDWEPAFYLAEIERRQGNWGSATALLVAAQQKHPQQPELAQALATLATRQAFWVDAMDEWKTYRRLRPDDLDALEQLAIVAQMGRRTRFAEYCMQQYLAARLAMPMPTICWP
jgi:predicted Zn-dependent protease